MKTVTEKWQWRNESNDSNDYDKKHTAAAINDKMATKSYGPKITLLQNYKLIENYTKFIQKWKQ